MFLVSAPPDQTVTANKDKEQHGNSSQKDLAVIAGLLLLSSVPASFSFDELKMTPSCLLFVILSICLHLRSFSPSHFSG